jgi:hypothetical protein
MSRVKIIDFEAICLKTQDLLSRLHSESVDTVNNALVDGLEFIYESNQASEELVHSHDLLDTLKQAYEDERLFMMNHQPGAAFSPVHDTPFSTIINCVGGYLQQKQMYDHPGLKTIEEAREMARSSKEGIEQLIEQAEPFMKREENKEHRQEFEDFKKRYEESSEEEIAQSFLEPIFFHYTVEGMMQFGMLHSAVDAILIKYGKKTGSQNN